MKMVNRLFCSCNTVQYWSVRILCFQLITHEHASILLNIIAQLQYPYRTDSFLFPSFIDLHKSLVKGNKFHFITCVSLCPFVLLSLCRSVCLPTIFHFPRLLFAFFMTFVSTQSGFRFRSATNPSSLFASHRSHTNNVKCSRTAMAMTPVMATRWTTNSFGDINNLHQEKIQVAPLVSIYPSTFFLFT